MSKLPFYQKYFFILASITLTFYILIVSRNIVNPILAASILALILKPTSSFIERFIPSRIVSSLCCVLLIVTILTIISMFFSTHVSTIIYELGSLNERVSDTFEKIYHWGSSLLNGDATLQAQYVKSSVSSLLNNSIGVVKNTVLMTTGFFSYLLLLVISLFFLLYYRRNLVVFLHDVFHNKYNAKINKTLYRIEEVLKRYIKGLLTVMLIIAILNTMGLLLLGIPHALLFGFLAALLTIIPYVGIIIGAALPVIFALLTKDSYWYALGVVGLFAFVQFLEGNFITPNVVGNEIKINPFAAILSLIVGGMLLGFTGIIFALPLLAIINVIFSQIKALQPLSYLISGSLPEHEKLNR